MQKAQNMMEKPLLLIKTVCSHSLLLVNTGVQFQHPPSGSSQYGIHINKNLKMLKRSSSCQYFRGFVSFSFLRQSFVVHAGSELLILLPRLLILLGLQVCTTHLTLTLLFLDKIYFISRQSFLVKVLETQKALIIHCVCSTIFNFEIKTLSTRKIGN